MYSRSRTCLSKGKVTDFVISQSRPNAPLDFLYPRWFTEGLARFNSAQGKAAHSTRNQLGGERYHHDDRSTPELRKQMLQDGGHGETLESTVMWVQYMEIRRFMLKAREDIHGLEAVVRRRKELAQVVERRLENRAGEQGEMTQSELTTHDGGMLRVRRPKIEGSDIPSRKAMKKLLLKHTHNPKHMIWTVPARILSDAMERPIPREGEEVLLREGTIISLTGVAYENAWIHNARGGCEVQVLPRAKGPSRKRRVILRGSQAARDLTKEYLLAEDRSIHDSAGTDEGFEGPSRLVVSREYTDLDSRDAIRADQLPLPELWSVKSFAQYVKDLCAMRLTRGVQRELYPDEETFQQNIAATLENLFTDEKLTPYFSNHAFNVALQFTSMHTQLGSTMELLYTTAKQLGVHRQIWTYNILIERALKMNQIDGLRDLVKDMQAASVVPDGFTWSKLILFLRSAAPRRPILDFVLQAYPEDFLAINAHIAQRLVEIEMVQHLAKEPDGLQFFIQRMDRAFGPRWITARTLEKVLTTCAYHGLWEAADEMVQLAFERKTEMTPGVIQALMYFHYMRGDLHAAIDLLQSPWVSELGYDSAYAVHWAFLVAWKRQRYNVCRVLWRYAASRGLISYEMQSQVYNSLIHNNRNLAVLPQRRSWEDVAGKFVIGTDLDTTNFEVQFPRLTKYFSTTKDPLQWLAQWTPNDGTRDEQLSLVYAIMHRDLTAWKVLKPVPKEDLPELLNAARRKDQAWVAQKFNQHATFVEMLANAIQVPLVPARQDESPPFDTGSPSMPVSTDPDTNVEWKPLGDLSSYMVTSTRAVLMLALDLSKLLSSLQAELQRRCAFRASSKSAWHFLAQWSGSQPRQAVT